MRFKLMDESTKYTEQNWTDPSLEEYAGTIEVNGCTSSIGKQYNALSASDFFLSSELSYIQMITLNINLW